MKIEAAQNKLAFPQLTLKLLLTFSPNLFQDGTVNIHSVLKGHYIMTLRTPCQPSWTLDIPRMVVSDTGQIILYCVERKQGQGPREQLVK